MVTWGFPGGAFPQHKVSVRIRFPCELGYKSWSQKITSLSYPMVCAFSFDAFLPAYYDGGNGCLRPLLDIASKNGDTLPVLPVAICRAN